MGPLIGFIGFVIAVSLFAGHLANQDNKHGARYEDPLWKKGHKEGYVVGVDPAELWEEEE